MRSKTIIALGVAILLLMALVSSLSMPAAAAPFLAPTPVAVARSSEQPVLATLFDGASITSDTRGGCVYTAPFDKLDVLYVIDQGATNTVTLRLQHTNDLPTEAGAAFADGAAVVSNNTSDATAMQQLQAFGAWTCIYADVTNTNTVMISAKALLK